MTSFDRSKVIRQINVITNASRPIDVNEDAKMKIDVMMTLASIIIN